MVHKAIPITVGCVGLVLLIVGIVLSQVLDSETRRHVTEVR